MSKNEYGSSFLIILKQGLIRKTHGFDNSKTSFDKENPWQKQSSPKSFLLPSKFSYITNSAKSPTYSPIPFPRDKIHYSLVVMSGGGVSYLI
jgi:hypothetical protein